MASEREPLSNTCRTPQGVATNSLETTAMAVAWRDRTCNIEIGQTQNVVGTEVHNSDNEAQLVPRKSNNRMLWHIMYRRS